MKKNLTCIVCPIGCSLEVEIENNNVVSVKGNTCPRGEKYAISECSNPERMVTTTIKCENGKVLPVKTDRPIPKDKVFECMSIINNHICNFCFIYLLNILIFLVLLGISIYIILSAFSNK